MIHHGDLFAVLPTLPAESIDACVTDPPYELSFMGKAWDGSGVAFRVETWREVLRVLKPGAYLLAFGGTRTYHRMAVAIEDAGFEMRDSLAWLYGSGFPKSRNLGNGHGTALKPAFEPIALAWKPFKGTISACHEKHGTAALNIDDCRIETDDALGGGGEKAETISANGHEGWDRPWKHNDAARARHAEKIRGNVAKAEALGRWPANVLIDEEAAAAIDEQTGELVSGAIDFSRTVDTSSRNVYGGFPNGDQRTGAYEANIDGASRFYYVAKPSREERDMGCYDCGNFHPTVKPVELMRWLVKLVTPIGGTVLDPFLGSGTTGMACVYEQREFIGIEREAEYIEIAERRIASVAPLFTIDGAQRIDHADGKVTVVQP
jgi:site-specific DNA-methyltransferase (adenine-specific)